MCTAGRQLEWQQGAVVAAAVAPPTPSGSSKLPCRPLPPQLPQWGLARPAPGPTEQPCCRPVGPASWQCHAGVCSRAAASWGSAATGDHVSGANGARAEGWHWTWLTTPWVPLTLVLTATAGARHVCSAAAADTLELTEENVERVLDEVGATALALPACPLPLLLLRGHCLRLVPFYSSPAAAAIT